MVASATSAVMILYTSFTATTSFMVFGLLEVCACFYIHSRARVAPLPSSSPSSLVLSCFWGFCALCGRGGHGHKQP